MKSVNPATGETIASHDEHDEAEVERRIASAAEAFRSWRETPVEERAALLGRLGDAYEGERDRLAEMMTAEMGKPVAQARAEIDKCIATFRHYAAHGPRMLEPERIPLANGGTAEKRFLPQGPVLAVMPWNFPFWQVVRFLTPTLLVGNVGLLKHASNVQGVAGLIEDMMGKAGAPEGLFRNLRIGSKRVAGVIEDERVVAVTLTGSEGAGAAVAEAAGRAIKKVVLELGGSDPFIVMPSADLDEAVAEAVKARIQNAGQSCICAKRMIVHEAVYEDFVARFSEAMRKVRVGDPTDEASEMGPLSSEEQRETVREQIEKFTGAGARLLFGGEPVGDQGAYLSPGALADVPLDEELMAEEIFGPVAMLFRAGDIDEAIAIANAVPFGLGSSVWTSDEAEKRRFVRDIEAGMTAVNQMLASSPEAPFGGVKRSGFGRELGAEGVHEFVNIKTVMLPG